jgi:hypothetical protein
MTEVTEKVQRPTFVTQTSCLPYRRTLFCRRVERSLHLEIIWRSPIRKSAIKQIGKSALRASWRTAGLNRTHP